jgi:[acyl-carrier-protein] S-malonyltransferase
MTQAKTAVLFPGQGSQYIGMGGDFAEADAEAAAIMDMAGEISGLPIRELCLRGPMEDLTAAENLQPALTAANLVCWHAVRQAGLRPDYFAGHSLGEYSALYAAGALGLEDTFRLVTARGRIMAAAGRENPGGMAAILGLDMGEVRDILRSIAAPDKISIGNYNSAQQIVISGAAATVKDACELAVARGGKAITLKVSIANHSPLMAAAVPEFERILAAAPLQKTVVPIFFNVTAAREENPAVIKDIMARQVVSMVRWLEIINNLLEAGVQTFIEVGPGKVLTGLLKRILPRGRCRCYRIDSLAALDKCRADGGLLVNLS